MPSDTPAQPVLRFAPSPNGALHLGHAYSALCNERLALEMGGRLLLRIEDLDRVRCKPRFEAGIMEDLAWLGIQFEASSRRQSEHRDDYDAALERLTARGIVYPCFCSRAEVAGLSGERDPDGAPLYAGTCRELAPAERSRRLERGDRVAWRLDMRRAIGCVRGHLTWSELGEGVIPVEHRAEPALWGDVILRGRDLAASYHLAVTVDDALQGVTDVVRGRDLLASTSVHRLLQDLLGLPAPRYRHHRLVLDPDGGKLSKSRRSAALAELRSRDVSPATVRRALGFVKGDEGCLEMTLS